MNKYDRLTALDASFLHMERLEYPMHVGAVSVLEGAHFFDENGHFRIGEMRDLVQSRLPLLPRFRRRLMNVPYDQGRPIWIDDDNFDIAYHVRLTALPKPGSWEQLVALTTRVQENLLDRGGPSGSCGSSRDSKTATSVSSRRRITRSSTGCRVSMSRRSSST